MAIGRDVKVEKTPDAVYKVTGAKDNKDIENIRAALDEVTRAVQEERGGEKPKLYDKLGDGIAIKESTLEEMTPVFGRIFRDDLERAIANQTTVAQPGHAAMGFSDKIGKSASPKKGSLKGEPEFQMGA